MRSGFVGRSFSDVLVVLIWSGPLIISFLPIFISILESTCLCLIWVQVMSLFRPLWLLLVIPVKGWRLSFIIKWLWIHSAGSSSSDVGVLILEIVLVGAVQIKTSSVIHLPTSSLLGSLVFIICKPILHEGPLELHWCLLSAWKAHF